MFSCCCEGAVTQAEGPAVAVPPPPQVDPVKAAADAEAEALKLAQLEALKKMNVVRRWCVKISTHEDFEFVVFVLIFANIVTLAMYNPLKSDSSRYNFILDRIREPATLPDADLTLTLSLCSCGYCTRALHCPHPLWLECTIYCWPQLQFNMIGKSIRLPFQLCT